MADDLNSILGLSSSIEGSAPASSENSGGGDLNSILGIGGERTTGSAQPPSAPVQMPVPPSAGLATSFQSQQEPAKLASPATPMTPEPPSQGLATSFKSQPVYEGDAPSVPIQQDPTTFADRFKMGVGNVQGNLDYLKTKYEDAAATPDHGLVVKKDGRWHQVDPTGWGEGDAWDKTKELAKDVIESPKEIANMVVQGTGAAMAPETLGASVPFAAAVSGGLAAAQTSLGRYFGTYKADEVEQLEDVGLEAILGGGAQAVVNNIPGAKTAVKEKLAEYAGKLPPGVQPTIKLYADATKQFLKDTSSTYVLNPIGKAYEKTIGDNIVTPAREVWYDFIGSYSGVGSVAAREFYQNTLESGRRISKFLTQAGGNGDTAEALAGESASKKIGLWAESVQKAIPDEWRNKLSTLINKAGGAGSVDAHGMFLNFFNQLEESGLGKLVKVPVKGEEKALAKDAAGNFIMDESGNFMGKNGQAMPVKKFKIEWHPNSTANQAGEMITQDAPNMAKGLWPDQVTQAANKSLQPLVNSFNALVDKGSGKVSGEVLADSIVKFNTLFNRMANTAGGDSAKATEAAVGQIKNKFMNAAQEVFDGMNVGQEFKTLSEPYTKWGGLLHQVRTALENEDKGGMEKLLKKLTGSANTAELRANVGRVGTLLNPEKNADFRDALMDWTASKFTKFGPKVGMVPRLIGAAAMGGAGLSVVGPVGAAAGIAASIASSSPRLASVAPRAMNAGVDVAKAAAPSAAVRAGAKAVLPYARQLLDHISGMPQEQRKALLNSPQALNQVLQMPADQAMQEQQLRDNLIQNANEAAK